MLRLLIGRVAGSRSGVATNQCNLAFFSTIQSAEDTSESASNEAQIENDEGKLMKMRKDQTTPSERFHGLSNRITVDGFLFSSCMYRKDDNGAVQSATFQLRHHEFEDGLQQDMFTVKMRFPRTILYALNNLHAGSKVRVRGRLGLKNSSGEIAIIAHHVLLLKDDKSESDTS